MHRQPRHNDKGFLFINVTHNDMHGFVEKQMQRNHGKQKNKLTELLKVYSTTEGPRKVLPFSFQEKNNSFIHFTGILCKFCYICYTLLNT